MSKTFVCEYLVKREEDEREWKTCGPPRGGGGRPAGLSMALAAVGAAPGCTDTRTVVVVAAAAAGTGKHPWSGQWGHSQTLRAALPTQLQHAPARTGTSPQNGAASLTRVQCQSPAHVRAHVPAVGVGAEVRRNEWRQGYASRRVQAPAQLPASCAHLSLSLSLAPRSRNFEKSREGRRKREEREKLRERGSEREVE